MRHRWARLCGLLLLGAALYCLPASAADLTSSGLDAGFSDMYNLQFDHAHQVFAQWQQAHPEDPMGPVGDAAAYLFSEFDRLHVLESEFFVNDKNFETSKQLVPDPAVRQRLFAQLDRAEALAKTELQRDPHNENALFASVLTCGLRADYTSLIEKHNVQALTYVKESRAHAEQLLGIDKSLYDAYLAGGVENYLLSLKPAPMRWLLRMDGAQTDRDAGIARLRLTAEKGHFLQPFARLLLAVAALRDKDVQQARQLLKGLSEQFPKNGLYARELARIH